MPTNEQRSVSVLLDVLATTGTYQEMSDAEIQSIVDYEKQRSYNEGQLHQMQDEYANNCASMQALTTTALQGQEDMLQSIIDRASNPQLQVIQYG